MRATHFYIYYTLNRLMSRLWRPSEKQLREIHRQLALFVQFHMKQDNPNARLKPFEMPFAHAADYTCDIEGITSVRFDGKLFKTLDSMVPGAQILTEVSPISGAIRKVEFSVPIARLRPAGNGKRASPQQQQQRVPSLSRAGYLFALDAAAVLVLVLYSRL